MTLLFHPDETKYFTYYLAGQSKKSVCAHCNKRHRLMPATDRINRKYARRLKLAARGNGKK